MSKPYYGDHPDYDSIKAESDAQKKWARRNAGFCPACRHYGCCPQCPEWIPERDETADEE